MPTTGFFRSIQANSQGHELWRFESMMTKVETKNDKYDGRGFYAATQT